MILFLTIGEKKENFYYPGTFSFGLSPHKFKIIVINSQHRQKKGVFAASVLIQLAPQQLSLTTPTGINAC